MAFFHPGTQENETVLSLRHSAQHQIVGFVLKAHGIFSAN